MKELFKRHGILLVLLLGYGLRVAMVLQGQDLQVRWDEVAYDDRARVLFDTFATYTDLMRPPVYPFLLGSIYEFIGDTRLIVGMLQAGISTVLIAGIFTLSRLLFGRRDIALLAALFTALYFEFLTLSRILMSETLFMALSILGAMILFHAWKTGRTREYILAGMVLALSALTRELMSYFVVLALPVWLVIAHYKQPRQLGLNVLALGLGILLVLGPWVIRNYRLENRFILSTAHSEIDLLRDNWRVELRAQGLPLKTQDGSMAKRVRKALAGVQGNRRSLFVLTRSVEAMTRFPAAWIADKFTRIQRFWRPFALEARVVRLETLAQPWRNLLQQFVSYSAVALLLLGTFGILTARHDAPKLLIALYILYSLCIFLMTHYLPRFRLPLLIFLIPYAAFAVMRVVEWLRAPDWNIFRQYPVRAVSTAIVLGLFIILALAR